MTKIEEYEFSDPEIGGCAGMLSGEEIAIDTGKKLIYLNKPDIIAMAEHFGLVVAPVEPTEKMSLAGMRVLQRSNSYATGVYKAMIKAAGEG